MVLRPTGPAKVEQDTSYSAPMAKALLYNFDIDGASLKSVHLNFLQSHAVPLLGTTRARSGCRAVPANPVPPRTI